MAPLASPGYAYVQAPHKLHTLRLLHMVWTRGRSIAAVVRPQGSRGSPAGLFYK